MASCYYSAAFHAGVVNALTPLGTLTLRHAGETDIVVNLGTLAHNDSNVTASQFFYHFFNDTTFQVIANDEYDTVRFPHYSIGSWGYAVTAAVQFKQILEGWPESNFSCQWYEEDLSGNRLPAYRFTNGSAFTWQFSTAYGARLFGMNATGESSSATTHSSFITPHFVVTPTVNGISAPSDEFSALDYEPRGIASLVHSDSGIAYGNSRLVAPTYRDWLQQFETRANVTREAALTPIHWTHQHLKSHCRQGYPFYVANGGFGTGWNYEVFMLRDDGAIMATRRASIANNAQLHEPYRCVVVGHIETPS